LLTAYAQAVTLKLTGLISQIRERPNCTHLAWTVAIFAVAVTTRSLWVAHAHANPWDGRYLDDTQFYQGSAMALADGRGYFHPFTEFATAQWPPGYSFFLAGLYRLLGQHVAIAWGANIVLGALTCVALYAVGNLISGKKVGVVAGLLLAVFPGHIAFSSLILSEILFTFLVVVTLALILLAGRKSDAGPWRIILIGVAVGVATLVRGQGLLLIFVAGLFWWLYTHDWARALQWTTVVGLTALAVIIPWSIRNYFAMGSFVLLSTNDGGNLYMGNWEGASGGFQYDAGTWIVDQFGYLPYNEQEVAASNALMREGLRFMFTHPGKEMQLTASKLRYLYNNDEDALNWINAPEAGKPLANRPLWAGISNGFYFTVLALSAGGLASWWRQRRSAVSLPLIFIGIFTLGQLPFFAIPRFHVPMLPSFCLLAAVGIVSTEGYLRSRWKGLGAPSH
jgi:4-amino-4-deoxy-L-arabinose transferase-like glycosyltransferase